MQINNLLKCILIFFLLTTFSDFAEAQKRGRIKSTSSKSKSRKAKDPFTQTQWWIGAKFGASLTQAEPTAYYSTFSPTIGNTANSYFKKYEDFKKAGYHAGLNITFFHKGLSFSLQPNYGRQSFSYSNDYEWTDSENPNNRLQLNYKQANNLDYLDIPLFIKYDILQTNFRPFVQIGGFYSSLVNADKTLTITGTDYASGSPNPFESEEIIVGAKDLFLNSSVGLLGGVGFSWDIGNIRVSMDVNYRYGMSNITNAANRYRDNQLASVGDALDDMKLRNIQMGFHILFPMRFLISKNFRAVD